MAVTCHRLLRTKEIIKASSCAYNKTIFKFSNCGKFSSRHFASNSKGNRNESDSSDSKTELEQKTDVTDSPKVTKSIWGEPIPEDFRSDHLPDAARNTEREYFQAASDPNRKLFFEGKYYTRKEGISKELLSWLHWNLNINDNEEISANIKRLEFTNHKTDQRYNSEKVKKIGPDLSAAHFIVSRGGAIKFEGRDNWYVRDSKNNYSIPSVYLDNLFIEAIDLHKMKLTYVGFDHLEKISHLRYLRINNCPYIDDWCLSRLQRLKHSLEFLDISGCPGVTDNGLSILHCLQNLKALHLHDLENVKHLGLLILLLEERNPNLVILGVKDEQLQPPPWKHRGERRLVRALLGHLDEEHDDTFGKVIELPSSDHEDYNNIMKRHIRRVE